MNLSLFCTNYNYSIGFAEKLFHNLESSHERFEVRLMTLDVVSRLIGLHQLIVLNFYPYIQKFLQPHQKGMLTLSLNLIYIICKALSQLVKNHRFMI